jgi:hypothetical protein
LTALRARPEHASIGGQRVALTEKESRKIENPAAPFRIQ